MKDKFKTNPVAKKIKAENKIKKPQTYLECEWASIILNDKKKVVKKYSAFDEYSEQEAFDYGTVAGYESAKLDFKVINRITWVLTAVNVAILISLVIKNV